MCTFTRIFRHVVDIVDLHAPTLFVFNIHRSIVRWLRIIIHHRLGVRLSEQSLKHERLAKRIYNLRVARFFRPRCDTVVAGSGYGRRYVRRV